MEETHEPKKHSEKEEIEDGLSSKTEAPHLPEFTFKNVCNDIINGVIALFMDPFCNAIVVPILVVFTSIACKIVIANVKYTEIDFKTYMQQIDMINDGELDYSLIAGDTGPIVYPAGFVQIYQWLSWLNLRHQAAVAAQQQYQPGEAGSPATMNRLSQGTPQVPHGQQPMNAILPFQQHMAQPVNSQPGPKTNDAHPNGAQGPPMPNGTAGGEMLNGATSAGPNRNINALQDYQMQLMLLEKQNKKRLDIARNNGTTDFSLVSMSNNVNNMNMLPPNTGNSGPQQKPSPGISGGSGSPSITKAPSPGSNGAKKKKERPVKRGRKPSTFGASQDAALGPNLSTNLKKEYTTPLTPSSEAPNEPATKKKKKAADSPKKQPAASTNAKGDKKDKESGTFNGSQQPNFEGGSNDQMFPILGGSSNNDNQMFGAGSNGGGLDDIDFDFNLFLDGGADANMHDGIGGFNWGNVDAIEGSEL